MTQVVGRAVSLCSLVTGWHQDQYYCVSGQDCTALTSPDTTEGPHFCVHPCHAGPIPSCTQCW